MSLAGTQSDLASSITDVLKNTHGLEYAYVEMEVPDENGNMHTVKYPLAGPANVKFSTGPNVKSRNVGSKGSDVTALEALAVIIAEKTVDHMVEHIELAYQARLDKLESDYNNLLIGLQIASTTLMAAPTMPPGACAGAGLAFTAAVAMGGSVARTATSEATKAADKVRTMNNDGQEL